MTAKDILKAAFSIFLGIVLVPIIDVFKIENGVIEKQPIKLNDSAFQIGLYVTKDYTKPVRLYAHILSNSHLEFDTGNINSFYLDDENATVEFKRSQNDIRERTSTTTEIGLVNLAKGEYTINVQFKNLDVSVEQFKKQVLVHIASNPNIGESPEVLRIVKASVFHFFYFYKVLTFIIICVTVFLFLLIFKTNKNEEKNPY